MRDEIALDQAIDYYDAVVQNTSLCAEGAIHHCAKHNITCRKAAYITSKEASLCFRTRAEHITSL